MRLLIALLLLVALPATAEQLITLDIAKASAGEVESLKHDSGDSWWVEMGDKLVLIGSPDALATKAAALPILNQRNNISPDRLMLRARGCSEHPEGHEASQRGMLLVQGSRWELRQLAEWERLSPDEEASGSWQSVIPNSTLARQYRLDMRGAAAPPQPAIQAIVDAIDTTRWFADVTKLADWDRSSYGTTELTAARDWIGAQFLSLGLNVTTPTFTMNAAGGGASITRNNVIGTWAGSSLANEWVIVGAHYDSRNANPASTINTPGAEDNATGCAGVIELARVLLPAQPSRSILFMCYAGEEQGLLGSKAHVQALTQDGDISKIKSVVIMDMIGYSASSNLSVLFESSPSFAAYTQQFAAAAATYVPSLNVLTSTNPFGSDHVPYLNAGVRTLLAIENDYGSYPHYHRTTDTPANIGPQALAMGGAILRANAAALADLVGILLPVPAFADGFEGVK